MDLDRLLSKRLGVYYYYNAEDEMVTSHPRLVYVSTYQSMFMFMYFVYLLKVKSIRGALKFQK